MTAESSGATVYYATVELTEENYKTAGSTENLTFTDAGTTKVYYCVVGGNYETVTGSKTVEITKAPAPDPSTLPADQKPAAHTDLVANGSAQQLVSPPSALPVGYDKVRYSIDGGKTWSDSIPTGTGEGRYAVQALYVSSGNYEDFTLDLTAAIGHYAVTFVEKRTWYQNSGKDLPFTLKFLVGEDASFDRSYQHFDSLRVGGKPWTKGTDYTVEEGSTIVTLKASALQKLAVARHEVIFSFNNGKVEDAIVIRPPSGGADTPPTGDESALGLWLALMPLSAAAALILLRKKKKNS